MVTIRRAARDAGSIPLRLRDGTRVRIRPLRGEDRRHLERGLGRMSEQSRFRRFLAAKPSLTPSELDYLTRLNYRDHFAWAAFMDEPDGAAAVGFARYVRLADEPAVAEPALTVIDAYQGRGLGTLLLKALSRTAVLNGITLFRSLVLADNGPMLRMLERGGAVVVPEDAGLVCVEFQPAAFARPLADALLRYRVRSVARSVGRAREPA